MRTGFLAKQKNTNKKLKRIMDHMSKRQIIEPKKSSGKKNYFYLMMNIAMIFVLPLISISIESIADKVSVNGMLIGKWFIFWAIGMRLFTAGIKQASNPEFTGKEIFKIKNSESYVVIRELGFANISMGVMGIFSVINENWRQIAAITGGLFFGLAALQHFIRKPASMNEVIAMIYDLIVFFGVLFLLAFTLFADGR